MQQQKDFLLSSLKEADAERNFGPWKQSIASSAGGLSAVGFDRKSETLLVVSSNGQAVFNCVSGERIYRNRDEDGYIPLLLEGCRLDKPDAEPFLMAGTDGGGLLAGTFDGWSTDILEIDWPSCYCIVQPPNTSIYFLYPKWLNCGKDASYHLISRDAKPVAFGFSWSGNSFVWCDRSDLLVWTRIR